MVSLPTPGLAVKPDPLIVPPMPPPATVQVNVGWWTNGWPNWSSATAENGCAPAELRAAVGGETTMLVKVW